MNSTKKIHAAILCGGQSAEHEVSLQSAKNIIQALDKNKYEILVIFISVEAEWILLDSTDVIISNPDMQSLSKPILGKQLIIKCGSPQPLELLHSRQPVHIDVVFPVLHGTHGEDGTLQGFLEILNLPYVGAGTLASAVCMDKEVTKKLLQVANIPVSKWLVATQENRAELTYEIVVEKLGLPLFIKPASTGSSVGVSKVKQAADFEKAVELAFHYDHKIIFEEFIPGREIECAVLGNGTVEASLPGEIISHHEFYSYEAKYLDPNGADLKVPAELPQHLIEKIRDLAKKVFTTLHCSGMARIDFFLCDDERLFVNEANTIPGFTPISMYPKMWMISGLGYSALIDRLIVLALERHKIGRVLIEQRSVALKKGQ